MKMRRCAWDTEQTTAFTHPVFARGRTVAFQCPKSIITPQSLEYIERFIYWKRSGGGDLWSLDAKTVDAMWVLEQESVKENKNEQK